MATEPSPATSETRVPQITRESTSRPTLSVPRRWARPGLARTLPRSCLRGSWGDTTGASTATTRAASITTTPRGARRVRAACRSTAHRRALTGGAATGPATTAAGSAISDPRIDPAIQEIHEQVAQDEADGDEQDHTLHERIVAREDGVHHQAPHAWQGKDVLGDDGAADQGAELGAEHRAHGVDGGVAPGGGEDSDGRGDDQRDGHGQPGQLEARPDALAHVLNHGLAVADRVAEVAAQEPAHPRHVLDVDRLVHPELPAEVLLHGGVGGLRHHDVDGIAGREL